MLKNGLKKVGRPLTQNTPRPRIPHATLPTKICDFIYRQKLNILLISNSIFFCQERHGPIFPPDWEMSERIAAEFCRITRADLSRLLQRRHREVDTKLLLHSIQKTSSFESLLSRRFTGWCCIYLLAACP